MYNKKSSHSLADDGIRVHQNDQLGHYAGRLQQFRAPDLHPLDVHGIVDVPKEVNMKRVNFLLEGYFLHLQLEL